MWLPSSIRQRIYRKIPLWIRNHDFEIFAVILCISAGLPLLFGEIDPASLNKQLPWYIVKLWATILIGGPLLIIIGVISTYRFRELKQRVFWMRVEALGLTSLAGACLVYGVCLLGLDAGKGWIPAMLTFVLMFVCVSRELDTQDKIDSYVRILGYER